VYLNGAAQGRTGGFELFGCRGDVSPLLVHRRPKRYNQCWPLVRPRRVFSRTDWSLFGFGDNFVWFSVGKMREKAKNDGFPEPEPSAHIRREAIGRFCHGSLLVMRLVVFPAPRCATDGHFRRTQRRSVPTVGHTFPKTHLTMATQAAVMSAKATKVRTRQSALAAGDNFPALVAFSPRSELRRVSTQALRHLRGVGWARFRPRSGLRDARNVSTTSARDVRGHFALA